MKIRKIGDKKWKVVLFQGSPRDKYSCPNMESKTSVVVEHIIQKWSPFINFKVIDLSVNSGDKPIIQPCKGCISTAGGYHCHFPCSCFGKGMKQPDLLSELDVYDQLKECDAFLIFSPIHWHSLSSQVKTLFDRLVCVNQTLSVEDAKKLMGNGNIKNAKITGKFSKSGKYNNLLRNHLEGKVAGFWAQGDDGANDYNGNQPHTGDLSWDVRNSVMPLVYQCRYSGINCPDDLVESFYINKGLDYFEANMQPNKELFERADNLMEKLIGHIDHP